MLQRVETYFKNVQQVVLGNQRFLGMSLIWSNTVFGMPMKTRHQWHLFLFFLVSFRGKAKGCRVFKGTLEPQESFACGLESDLIHWSKISQSIPIRDFASFSLLPGHYHWCFGSRWFAHETDWTPWNCPEIVGRKHDIPAWVQGEAYHLEAEMKDWMGLYRREHLLSTSAPFSVLLTAKDGAVCECLWSVFLKCILLR